MNIPKLRTLLISAVLAVSSSSLVQAQSVTVNGVSCAGASVTLGAGTIAINTANCGGGQTAVAPVITASTPPGGTTGAFYSHTFVASGTPAPTWSTNGAPPAGLSLNASSGVLSGTPTASGPITFNVIATNSAGASAPLPVSITIAPPSGPPVIQNTATATAAIGALYSFQFTATGALGTTYTFTGTLPPGLNLSATGLLAGTPTAGGTYSFTVTAANGTAPNATQPVTITVTAPTPPTIISFSPPGATQGTAYNFAFGANGTAPFTWALASGALPAGLNISSAGIISGTPTATGTSTFTVTATNGGDTATSASISITVAAAGALGPITQDINGNPIPNPSKGAKAAGATHPAPSGGGNYGNGEIRAWAVNPARCANTTPAINTLWYHNISFFDYGAQNSIDYLEFGPNQALVYGFTAPTLATGFTTYIGNIFLTTGPVGTPATSFVSISTTPCDFDVTKVSTTTACYTVGGNENGFGFQITNNNTGACKLVPGQQYYLNIRFQDARPAPVGAPTVDACSTQNASSCGLLLKVSITGAF